jgi:hypothetical protein
MEVVQLLKPDKLIRLGGFKRGILFAKIKNIQI